MADSEQNGDTSENCRSAFSVLKPQRKKNLAPVVRTGDAVIEPSRTALTIGRQQPLPRNNLPSTKVPFKIYNAENLPPPLPLQSENAAPFILHSDVSKENEKKPSKWNNVKMKQAVSFVRSVENANPGFTLHCDEAPQPSSTPRSIPKVSNVLRSRQQSSSPPMALFESPDPKKKPMYDKTKVYGGAKEFSLEEIRAAAWIKTRNESEKQKKIVEQEVILREQQEQLREQQEQIKNLVQQMQMLKTNKFSTITDENKLPEIIPVDMHNFSKSNTKNSQEQSCASQRELSSDHKLTSTYSDASHMIRDLYNGTFANAPDDFFNSEHSERKGSPEFRSKNSAFKGIGSHHLSHEVSLEKNAQWCKNSVISNENSEVPFMLYRDPTENIQQLMGYVLPNSLNQAHPAPFSSSSEINKENEENVPPNGYVQESNQRELNGILEPSKNVMFVPIELQELEDDDDEEDYELDQQGVYKENNNHPLQDQTLIPPCNTEQFVTAVCLSSTPRTQLKRLHLVESSSEDARQTNFKSCDPSGDYYNPASLKITSQDDAKQISKIEVRTAKDQSTFPGLPAQLSVIMETSRECYKSSSSSGSSQSATKLSQFSQCLSHEKSNIQKHLSRFDTFREPKPICKAGDLSANTNENAFKEPKPVVHLTETSSKMIEQDAGFKKPIAQKVSPLNNSSKKDTNQEEDVFEIYTSSVDPFDSKLQTRILESLHLPPDHFGKLQIIDQKLNTLKVGDHLNFGNMMCTVQNLVSEGAFGKVHEAEIQRSYQQNCNKEDNSTVALKVCKNINDWELYICNTLHKRLTDRKELPDIRMSVMEVISAQRYSNGIILASEFSHHGTLLDLVNFYKKQNILMPETISMYLTLEMLQIMSKIHTCGIIHADVKPDNILMRDDVFDFDVLDLLDQKTALLKLIDFGRAIDLKAGMFKSGVCFTTIVSDNCIEMRENKPWVFQLDWFGFLNCVHVLLFSEYMKVKKNSAGKWAIEKKFKRYWDQTVWAPLFDELLNIQSCYEEPNVEKFTVLIKSKLRLLGQSFRSQFQRLLLFYEKK